MENCKLFDNGHNLIKSSTSFWACSLLINVLVCVCLDGLTSNGAKKLYKSL